MGYELDTRKEADKAAWDQKLDWADLGAAGYSALDSALFGIPSVIVKAASQDAYKALQKLREENKAASTIGDILGAFVPTGGLLVKGIGGAVKLGAKALGQTGRVAKVLGGLGQGADTAADIIKTGGKLKGVGGAAARGALTAAEQVAPRLLTGNMTPEEAARNVAMGGAFGGGLSLLGKGSKLLKKVAPEITEAGEKGMLSRLGFNDKATKVGIFGTELPELVGDVAGKASKAESLSRLGPQMRAAAVETLKLNKALHPLSFKNFAGGDITQADLSKLISKANPGIAADVVDATAGMMKHAAAMGEVGMAEGKDLLKNLVAKNPLLVGGAAAGGIGSIGKDLLEGEEIDTAALSRAATGAGLGALAGRYGAGAVRAGGKVLEGLSGSPTANSILSKLQPIASKLEDPAAAGAKLIGAQSDVPEQAVETTEAQAEPAAVEEAKEEVNEKYLGTLRSIMQQDYQTYFADQMSYEDFEAQISAMTDGFNPIKTAAIVFKDPVARDKYLRDYNVAIKMKDIDLDRTTKGPGAFEALINPGRVAEQKKAYSDMVDTISSLVTKPGDLPSSTTTKQIAADIKAIADLPSSGAEKKELLMQKLQEKYGLSIDLLTSLGVL